MGVATLAATVATALHILGKYVVLVHSIVSLFAIGPGRLFLIDVTVVGVPLVTMEETLTGRNLMVVVALDNVLILPNIVATFGTVLCAEMGTCVARVVMPKTPHTHAKLLQLGVIVLMIVVVVAKGYLIQYIKIAAALTMNVRLQRRHAATKGMIHIRALIHTAHPQRYVVGRMGVAQQP